MPIRRSVYGDLDLTPASLNVASVSTLPTVMAMQRAFEDYLNLTIADGNPSLDTVKTYRSRLAQFLRWCKKRELYPALVKKQNILEYRKHLINCSSSSSTIRLTLTAIRHFYTANLNAGLVKDNPALGVKAPRDKREIGATIGYLSEEELQQLFDSIAPTYRLRDDNAVRLQVLRDRLIIGLMALQGCRTVELHRASWGDIFQLNDESYLEVDGKNSLRKMLLRADIASEIERYRLSRQNSEKLSSASPLFTSLSNRSYGSRLSRSAISYTVNFYLARCNLKHGDLKREARSAGASSRSPSKKRSISPHGLRHTAGTLSLQNGSSLREVQDFLGHADPKTTAVYTHILEGQKHNPAARINVIFSENN